MQNLIIRAAVFVALILAAVAVAQDKPSVDIALIDNADVVERILRHLNLWDPPPETFHCAGPDPVPNHTTAAVPGTSCIHQAATSQ